jgi:hypothetical protein
MNNSNRKSSPSIDHRELVALPRLVIRSSERQIATNEMPGSMRFGMVAAPGRDGTVTAKAGVDATAFSDHVASALDFSRPVSQGTESGKRTIADVLADGTALRARINALLRSLVILPILGLGACTSFTQPMTDMELRAEADSCAKSALCRVLIEDRPPVLSLAVNDAALCELNAQRAERILEREGVETRRFIVRLNPVDSRGFKTSGAQSQLMHTFVAARVDGKWFAVDNGSLPHCDQICKLSEALHNVELVSSNNDYHLAVRKAAASGATVASNP